MLYLPQPTASNLDGFYNSLKDKISILAISNLPPNASAYLTTSKIKEIITVKPQQLLEIHNEFMPLLIAGFDINEYENYFIYKKLKVRNPAQSAIIVKYSSVFQLTKIFNYDKYISSSKSTSYNFALKLGRNTCTYCNRLYTNTVVKKDVHTNRMNNKGRITRPQFDHWFAKSKFPILGLSYFNLIPSCSVCNSSIKGDAVFDLATHSHPYLTKEDDFKFSFNFKDVSENNVTVNSVAGTKIEKILQEFKINEVYNAHSALELKDLLDLKYKYTENYINTLFNESFATLGVKKEEAYRLIFGVEHDEVDFHKRAFSKFKKDILEELKVI
jgi:aspartate carbamoyltransferase regulatory subunit